MLDYIILFILIVIVIVQCIKLYAYKKENTKLSIICEKILCVLFTLDSILLGWDVIIILMFNPSIIDRLIFVLIEIDFIVSAITYWRKVLKRR